MSTATMAKSGKKSDIKIVKEKTKDFLNDRKNANNLVDIISYLEVENEDVILAAVRSSNRIFSTLITGKQMYMEKPPVLAEDFKDLSAEEKYQIWLRERYIGCRERLLELLSHENGNIQEQSLLALLKFVEAEGHTPLKKISDRHLFFPTVFYEQIVVALLNETQKMTMIISRFQEFLEIDDVRYFTMKLLLKDLKSKKSEDLAECYLMNAFSLLQSLSMPLLPPDDENLVRFLTKIPDAESSLKVNTYKEHKKLFTSVWLEFLRKKLTASIYKKVLVILHEKVMPFMSNPLLLSDFLTTSYDIGGAISLLALNGIFILVNKFNLEYPDFYKKLYALFEPSVFYVKYKARFFFLADLFLTSTHIPAYLVAAFAKKLSRLALTAPPGGLTVIIPFIYNLVNRHPNCKALLHRPDGPTDLAADPFDMNELDPTKCNALESSLWELKTLENHYYHSVAMEAKKIQHPLQPDEIDLGEILETTTDSLFSREVKKKMKTMPVTFEAPKGLFSSKNDKVAKLWILA